MLLNQAWTHTPERNKASLRQQVAVKERETIVIKVPKQRGQVACALNPRLPEGFQQAVYRSHEGRGQRTLNPGLPGGFQESSLQAAWGGGGRVTEFVIRWCTVL